MIDWSPGSPGFFVFRSSENGMANSHILHVGTCFVPHYLPWNAS